LSGMSIPAIRGIVVSDVGSALSLLQPWVLLVNDEALALADNNLTIECSALDTASNLHE